MVGLSVCLTVFQYLNISDRFSNILHEGKNNEEFPYGLQTELHYLLVCIPYTTVFNDFMSDFMCEPILLSLIVGGLMNRGGRKLAIC